MKSLKDNYMAGYQEFLLDREDKYDLDSIRLCLAIKYLSSKKESDELALRLLNNDLDEYFDLIKTRGPLELKNLCPYKSSKKIKKFKSTLQGPEDIIKHIKSLPCQTDELKSCKKIIPDDNDIKSIVNIWNLSEKKEKKNEIPSCSNKNIQQVELILSKKEEKRKQFMEIFNKMNNKSKSRKMEDELNPPNKKGKTDSKSFEFKSATTIKIEEKKKQQNNSNKKTLERKGGSISNPFICPIKRTLEKENQDNLIDNNDDDDDDGDGNNTMEIDDERLKNIDPKMIELIKNEIMDSGSVISWDDVAGLEAAKRIIKEVIVFPMLRPDIFTGLRRPPKGILLFGPPGTGKTLIGKCIASQSKSTFFSISASCLTSKWVGEGEKMVRALFAVARVYQPSVIFIDEIDSLLTQRSETEHESSRRIKTEFLVQLDGATTGDNDRILVIGATNRPHELDEAARRRFVKRLYIPLPEHKARKQIIVNLLSNESHNLTQQDVEKIAKLSDNYSGADMANLCKEASMGPIRSISFDQLQNIKKEDVRCVTVDDFHQALNFVRPSVSQADLNIYVKWDSTYGSGTADKNSTTST